MKFKESTIIKSGHQSSHTHFSNFSPENNFLFSHDLGADKIRKFKFNTLRGKLENYQGKSVKPGSIPRHFAFHPNGKYGDGVNELSGTIDVYQYENGSLSFIEDYNTYQKKLEICRAADIHISTNVKFLYAT